jgi:hypothetical protein
VYCGGESWALNTTCDKGTRVLLLWRLLRSVVGFTLCIRGEMRILTRFRKLIFNGKINRTCGENDIKDCLNAWISKSS